MKKIIIILSLFFIGASVNAQTGTIKGNVKDAKTGEAIIGASVVIQGTTTGAATDVEGNFSIPKVASGTYSLVLSYVSYKNLIIPNVIVQANKSTVINTSLEENISELGIIEVTATREKSTEMAVITEIKEAQQVAVGISAQQITKSQDRDAAQVIKRVPGISIVDERFVVIRGLSQRYNAVMLNDAMTPSSEVDTRAFSFDMIPSSSIDRLMIFKSGSPELPGDFAGGVIKIYTKNIPDRNDFNVNLSLSYRHGVTANVFQKYNGSGTDFLGFDNGQRTLPVDFPSKNELNGNQSETVITKLRNLPDYYTLNQNKSLPDLRFGISWARKFNIGNTRGSNITNINYSNTKQYQVVNSYRYNSQGSRDSSIYFHDDKYLNNVRLGVLSNFAFWVSPNSKIEFRNLFNQFGVDQTTIRNGINYDNNHSDTKGGFFRYESRSIYSGQLNGSHDISDNTTVNWTGGFSYTFRNQPDYRIFNSSKQDNNPFQVDVPLASPSLSMSSRFYSKLNEYVEMVSANVEHTLNNETDKEKQIKFRTGFYLENKNRDFEARWLGYVNPGNNEVTIPFNEFYNSANLGASKFTMKEGTNFDDRYTASNVLTAAYIGTTIPLNKFNISGGIRAEYNMQQVNSKKRGSGIPLISDSKVFRPLPSVNVTYKFNEKSLLRLAYSITLNRPEFRELANFTYFDADLYVGYTGNPLLKTAFIQNLDLRKEFYPSEDEIITVGVFGKYFKNTIEQKIRNAGSGIQYSYENSDRAVSVGTEIEVKKSFVNLSNIKFVQNLSLILNSSIIYSRVYLDAVKFDGQELKRPMQGQSPYLVNAGLYYNNPEIGLQVNALYNVIGKRLFIVGDKDNPSIYEMPRNVIDITFTKSINQHFEIKGGVQDLLNQKTRLIQDSTKDNKITSADGTYQSFKRGTYSTLGISYKF